MRFADPPEDSSTSEGESIRGLGDDPGVRVSLNQLGILMDFSTKKTKAFADENFDDCY